MTRNKYILHEDGRLYLTVHIVITTNRGRQFSGTRTGNAYGTDVARDFNSMKERAVYDAYYQFKKENGLSINYSDDIEYDVLDYEIDYNYSDLKESKYRREVVYKRVGKRKVRYVNVYREDELYKSERYVTKSKEIKKDPVHAPKLSREKQRDLNKNKK